MTTAGMAGGSAAQADASAAPLQAQQADVLVVGGGPAGSTAATLLARRGWRVTMLEKAVHPRFHVGESLLPMSMPILQRLGALEKVARIGVHKRGADFPHDGGYNVFHFARAYEARFPHAYQVRRADFDQVLFEHARGEGVDARDGIRVEQVACGGSGGATVHARDGDGRAHVFKARYVVDASGRDAVLGSALGLRRRNARHQSAALFSHYRGVARRPGDDAGNISIYRHAHGWIWLIPLPDDVMSIGAVCDPGHLKTRKGDSEGFLHRTLATVPEIVARMQGAERVEPVHATGNYAYECTHMAGPGWVLVGDAYAFVDPMFSSGVFLGMHSAEQAAGMVDAALRDPAREPALQRRLQRRFDAGLAEFKWFIYRFNSPVMQYLFANPRNHLRIEDAVIAMLAGDVFDSAGVRLRLRLFRVLYALAAIRMWPRAVRHRLRHGRQSGIGFSGDTLQAGEP